MITPLTSVFLWVWASGGVAGGAKANSWILKLVISYYIFSKKGRFLSLRWKNEISSLLCPLEKFLWLPVEKFAKGSPLEKVLTTPIFV